MVHSPKKALLAAAGLLGVAVASWVFTFVAPFGDSADERALDGFNSLRGARVDAAAHHLASLADPAPFIFFGLVLIAIALLRGRPRLALVVVFVMAGANITTQILKPLLGVDRFAAFLGRAQIAAGSWPSGHSTAAMAMALCAVLVATPRLRPYVAAIAAAFALAISCSVLTLGWHYPSDVFAGLLVAAIWTALGIAALWAADARWPVRSGRDAVGRARASMKAEEVLAPAGAAIGAAALLAFLRRGTVIEYASAHTVFFVFVLLLSLLALTLAAGLALALRR